jgi:MFS family permease
MQNSNIKLIRSSAAVDIMCRPTDTTRRDDGHITETINDDQSRHNTAIVALGACSLCNGFLMISVFPYSGFMVLTLLPYTTPETAGTYAGFLAASFMLGRFLTAYEWGRLADIYGRVFVLQTSLVLSAVFSILFGTSQTYTMAIIWRCCLGMSNGMISTIKTSALEIGHGDEAKEKRAMGLVIGVRSYSYLLGPALGGFLAEPLQQYPNVSWLQNGWWAPLLERCPFLLPNLVVALICLSASLAVALFLEETLPASKCRDPSLIGHDFTSWIASSWRRTTQTCRGGSTDEVRMLLPNQQSPLKDKTDDDVDDRSQQTSIWDRSITRRHIIMHCVFSFVCTCIDEAFPLFCMSSIGGLSLAESSIGNILSIAGILFVLLQYAVYSGVMDRYGMYPAIRIGCIASVIPAGLIPLSVLLSSKGAPSWLVQGSLSIFMGISKIMTCLYFSAMSLATNKTVESTQRAKLNALVAVGISIAKGLGPIFAGALVSASFSSPWLVPPEYGSVLIFSTITLLGLEVYRRVRNLERDMKLKELEAEMELESTKNPSA